MQRDAEIVIDDARRAAFELLASVRRDDVYANLQWPAVLERYGWSLHKRGYAKGLTVFRYGPFRREAHRGA